MSQIITLTTDFGLQDHYVGVLKAILLRISPDSRLVDISHEIPPQDVMAGAWVVRNAATSFPEGTVHLVVVDPGVGTERRSVVVEMGDQLFVGPDNGIFSLLAEEAPYRAFEIGRKDLYEPKLSNTFHGRDLFAPVAAHLANGLPIDEVGTEVSELITYRWARPIADGAGIQGWVVHIDRFGNLVTNIPDDLIQSAIGSQNMKIYVGNTILKEFSRSFGSVEEGDPVAYIGSSDMLEVAINKGDASQMLGVQKGAQVSIVIQR